MVDLSEIVGYLDRLLEPAAFHDYCPNGLQVQGRDHIALLLGGVTASRALIERAVDRGAGALLVHHGYFWKGEDPCVCAIKRARLRLLLCNDISLIAYHLPLDAHPEFGNNVRLAEVLGLEVDGLLDPGGDAARGLHGHLPQPLSAGEFAELVAARLGRAPLLVPGGRGPVRRLGWCSGAAQGFIELAAARGLDAYLSGEISESTVHAAREHGIHYYGAGHHATERFGVRALGEHLVGRFDLEFEFADIDNPA